MYIQSGLFLGGLLLNVGLSCLHSIYDINTFLSIYVPSIISGYSCEPNG